MKPTIALIAILIGLIGLPAAPASAATAAGWEATYWNNTDLSGQPVLVRNESNLDHDWGTGSPGAAVNADGFSARWQRSIELPAGAYRFTATGDDGMRVWLNGVRIVDEWRDRPATTTTVDRQLSAGFHLLVVEYYENLGDAVARLSWAPVGQAQNWRGEYYTNKNLNGSPALVRDDADVQFDWGQGAPAAGLPADHFSARWTRTLNLAAGRYRFTVVADDGAKLWVNNQLLVDAWRDQSATTYTGEIQLPGGGVPVKLEYYENLGDAVARLSWAPVGQAQAWRGEYYTNKNLNGTPALVRDDADIQFDWGEGAPAAGLPADRFSARWTRTLNLAAGRYRFTAIADDGVKLWVNNQLLVDAWRDQPATTYTAEIQVPAGGVPVKLEYYENLGGAVARLSWAPLGQVQNWKGEYYANKDLSGTPALVRDDADIQFTWGQGAPAAGLPADRFSARWTRVLSLEAGRYRFTAIADDGVRLWVNNQLLIDAWRDQPATTYSGEIQVPAGGVPVRLEYYENGVDATVRLSWAPAGAAPAWRGEYYANRNLTGAPALVRDDAQIQFRWGPGAPAAGLPSDNFSVRWARQVPLQAGTYRFTVTADDGVRLWVNNHLLIDAWRIQAPTTYSGEIYVPAGSVPVRLEYFEASGGASVYLSWVKR